VRLEGTLDAFSLPDIFQLLSFTKKTGTLHLRREDGHGVVHLRAGSVTGGRADITRQELGRRLLGAGLVDDEVLAAAAEDLAGDPDLSLAQLLAEKGRLDVSTVRALAEEQATDAVFSLLRWSDGEFAFVVDEADPDDLGALVPVEQVVTEGQRRIEAWSAMVESVPAPSAVVSVNTAPDQDPSASRDEWALLSLVDGRRTVADLVGLSGRGEYAVVSALAALVSRGLLVVRPAAEDHLVRRQSLLAALEGRPVEAPEVPAQPAAAPAKHSAPAAAKQPAAPAAPAAAPKHPAAPVIPERPEPFTPARRPDHAEGSPAFARTTSPASSARPTTAGGAGHGSVDGATALAPDASADPAAAPAIERDPSVNKSLLLRLIAGVRGL
jgi:hypothetical protein